MGLNEKRIPEPVNSAFESHLLETTAVQETISISVGRKDNEKAGTQLEMSNYRAPLSNGGFLLRLAETQTPNYGWVIILAAFFCSFIVDGVAGAFGMYRVELKELYPNEPHYLISFIGSLIYGVYLLMGPISCGLAETFGYRSTIMLGAVIASVGFFSSCYVTHLLWLYLTFGIIGGIGFGLIYSPSIMCVCSHFKERNALAVSITVCGSSVGGMLSPLIVPLLIEEYGWRSSMLFLSAASFQCCVAGALMRRPPPSAEAIQESVKNDERSFWLPPKIREALGDMMSVKVYTSRIFLLYNIASFICSIAFLTPLFFLPSFAISMFGVEKFVSGWTVTSMSAAGIFGRVFFGWLADGSHLEPLRIHNISIFISGVVLALVPLCPTFEILLFAAVLYGFFVAPYIGLMSSILTSRLGLEQLPNAFGQTQLIAGIASLLGPPLTDKLGEDTEAISFYVAGGGWILATLIASLIFLLPPQKSSTGRVPERILPTAQLNPVVAV
ncbi:putative Monocarboxylate transporter 14 [Hypsibius exemplaris]|uniref:Monocarboxylate transporter 14 n=1 Tax=Hypsibius exemplaris TaxID=2072580 RepID=A0A1W0XES1_HYPEX|nr:putative Monocarboxylate transporter 14 [Hypsibius exemplaris]